MSDPDEMLAASRILDDLPERVAKQIERLDVVVETTSTNADLLALDPPSAGRLRVLLAEQQTAGRGRRGRQWQSPPGSGLCLSVAFRLAADDGDLGALSLVLGVALVASGCAMKQKRTLESLENPIDCRIAEGDLRVLESEKAHVGKRIVEGFTAITPAGAVIGAIAGTERTKLEVATGAYNRKIDERIAAIQEECSL